MKLKTSLKKLLMDEMNYITDKIENANSPEEVIYYLSAVYGVIQRIFSFEYHSELVHLWVILNPLYQALNQKFATPTAQFDDSSPVILERLVKLINRLRDEFEDNSDLSKIIEDFAVLLYSSNGNGNYLLKKGMLKLED
jgi:hypothetical protein